MKFVTIITFFLVISCVKCQVQDITCNFILHPVLMQYSCVIGGQTIPNNPDLQLNFVGEHLSGRSNVDVQSIQIYNSNIPFVNSQFFTTFPWATNLINSRGIVRLQSNAFRNGSSLNMVEMVDNNNLRSIESFAFTGAANLRLINLQRNAIESIHEDAFNGLVSLTSLFLRFNNIQQLHHRTFTTTNLISYVSFDDNQIEFLDERIFSSNAGMQIINLENNKINKIGRNFLSGLNSLGTLTLSGNVCIDKNFSLFNNATIDSVNKELAYCFANADGDELRRFVLEIRGPFSLKFENGTEIIRV